ncbi:MAG: TetR/AcrR family transcriptional regulator C-terminal ligand-binding domain-containing protein [Arthrobacter sp.]|nr:TetR/AcrR family transcriptional regulator C-terminal ligand-binding domain-containing protein [Arthrobacter sp.]
MAAEALGLSLHDGARPGSGPASPAAGVGAATGSLAGAAEPAGRRPGRPRDEGLETKVLDAVVHLLATTPAGEPITIGAMVEASGTSRAAIYRRWPDQRALIVAALDHVRTEPPVPVEELPLSESLVELYASGVEQVDDLQRSLIARRLVLGLQDSELQRQYWERHVSRRRTALLGRLRRAQASGELRCDVDLEATVDLLNGVHYYQFVVRGQWGGPGYAERVEAAIGIVLRGIAA